MKYTGKIYKHTQVSIYTVRFLDYNGVKRESLPVKIIGGDAQGLTMDLYEYKGQLHFKDTSIRKETISMEEEIMEEVPVSPDLRKLVAVECQNCGASFEAVAEYVNRCPYCGSSTQKIKA